MDAIRIELWPLSLERPLRYPFYMCGERGSPQGVET